MLTYQLQKSPGVPLYEALYRCIRQDILTGRLRPGDKLPSKRTLAEHLEVSKITVEGAYSQLLAEGFIRSQEKVGYFVEAVEGIGPVPAGAAAENQTQAQPWLVDLTANSTQQFPFSVWTRLQREVLLDYGENLLSPMPNQGIWELRQAIAQHLEAFRGMTVDPNTIVVGAGTDFLYNLLIQLLGRDKVYALEEPGYRKIRQIYQANGVVCRSAALDGAGVEPESLADAQILHCSPAHHFPTGLVMPLHRRQSLLAWAREGRWIIEDDYDSEFRFDGHPLPTLSSLDGGHRVIYINSFSKTLAPSLRMGYLVLPPELMEVFQRKLGFYGCTVPSFEQYTLARFLSRGHFEKHLNRMRKCYKSRRNAVISLLQQSKFAHRLTILEENAGLHFLVKVDTELTDQELTGFLSQVGIRVEALSQYCFQDRTDRHILVVNYSGIREEQMGEAIRRIEGLL